MSMDRTAIQAAAEKYKLPQIIVGYLKLQQAKNSDFFTLLIDKKINGRLFYNTCSPGEKEIRYGNEDFLQPDFKNAIENLVIPFATLSLSQVKNESVHPSALTEKMRNAINTFMQCIETSREWQQFWNHELHLQSDSMQRKELYNLVAGAAAYKAFVSCIDKSDIIADPAIKRNIAALVGICTNHYEAPSTQMMNDISLKQAVELKEKSQGNDFRVFKKSSNDSKSNHPVKRKRHKRKLAHECANALVK